MKAKQFILITMLLLAGLISLQASETKELTSAKKQLNSQIESLFNYVPFEDVLKGEDCCTLKITFKVNNSQKLQDIVVEGNNEDLVHYAKMVLKNNNIKTDSELAGNVYSVSMKFVYKS